MPIALTYGAKLRSIEILIWVRLASGLGVLAQLGRPDGEATLINLPREREDCSSQVVQVWDSRGAPPFLERKEEQRIGFAEEQAMNGRLRTGVDGVGSVETRTKPLRSPTFSSSIALAKPHNPPCRQPATSLQTPPWLPPKTYGVGGRRGIGEAHRRCVRSAIRQASMEGLTEGGRKV